MRSCTEQTQILSSLWYGSFESVTVIDTPGFLDSENCDADFLSEIVEFLQKFPKDKLRVVVVTLPLMETRAKSIYKDTIDEIELLLGSDVWDRTIFVTTMSNQLVDPELSK
jgi:predicted GTPase